MKVSSELKKYILDLASCAVPMVDEGWVDLDAAIETRGRKIVIFPPELLGWEGQSHARNIACVVNGKISWFIKPKFMSKLPSYFHSMKWTSDGIIYLFDDRDYRYQLKIKSGEPFGGNPIEDLFT